MCCPPVLEAFHCCSTIQPDDDGYDDGYEDIDDDDEMNLAECDGANDVKSHCGQQLPL